MRICMIDRPYSNCGRWHTQCICETCCVGWYTVQMADRWIPDVWRRLDVAATSDESVFARHAGRAGWWSRLYTFCRWTCWQEDWTHWWVTVLWLAVCPCVCLYDVSSSTSAADEHSGKNRTYSWIWDYGLCLSVRMYVTNACCLCVTEFHIFFVAKSSVWIFGGFSVI